MTYDAKHPDVMARLPAFLAAQLSITFTHSGAMDDDMLQHIHHDVMKGLSFQAACDRAASFLRHNHNQAELEFLSLWNYQQQPGTQTLLDCPALSGAPPQFGTFWQCRPLQALHIKQPARCWHMAGKIPPLGCLCISLHCRVSRKLPVA